MFFIHAIIGIVLSLSVHPDNTGILFSVKTDTPHHFYVLAESTPGIAIEPIQFEFDLAAGESFGATINAAPQLNAYTGPEYVTVSVWDDGGAPVAVQRIERPRSPYPHVYIPLIR